MIESQKLIDDVSHAAMSYSQNRHDEHCSRRLTDAYNALSNHINSLKFEMQSMRDALSAYRDPEYSNSPIATAARILNIKLIKENDKNLEKLNSAWEEILRLESVIDNTNEAEKVLALLDSCEWELHRVAPSSYLTDEANKEHAWLVRRTQAPYCDSKGIRQWSGPTAYKTLKLASAAIANAVSLRADE